jgi:hypothetical protein
LGIIVRSSRRNTKSVIRTAADKAKHCCRDSAYLLLGLIGWLVVDFCSVFASRRREEAKHNQKEQLPLGTNTNRFLVQRASKQVTYYCTTKRNRLEKIDDYCSNEE